MATWKQLIKEINNYNPRSAWDKGVKKYAYEVIQRVSEGRSNTIPKNFDEKFLLSGASNWKQYSYGGCSYVYDGDIAKMLCTPSELKKVRYKEGGFRKPNAREEWLDVQARALYQASKLILDAHYALRNNKHLTDFYGY